MQDIISAISTANGTGGVAIIRISGDGALSLASKMFKPVGKVKVENFEPYRMYVGEIDGGDFTDFGMMVYFKGPKSYTGEDMVEFHSHGGIAIQKGILKQTFRLGAVPATRGEFTKRAFVNGKLSLDGAEGLISMINSESVASVKLGYGLYREKLNAKVSALQDALTFSLASINADIDYPEEDLEELALNSVVDTLKNTVTEIDALISKYNSGAKIISGVKVAIVGKPNTGKSSLLNAILNYDKAIVSSVAGTTRDVVEGSAEIGGVTFNFYDTAGIHTSSDEIELQGIERSQKFLKSADVVLLTFDASKPFTAEDGEITASCTGKNVIKVYNKHDLGFTSDFTDGITISAKTGEGIPALKQALYDAAFTEGIDFNAEFITEERHLRALELAKQNALEAINNVGLVPLDLISEDIRKVWDNLGEITGETATEEIINEIFSKFCVGK